jgi:hypothetical protein
MENPFRTIFQALSEAGIRYLVAGGVAVNLHGYLRFTGDLDILLALDKENLEKMASLMRTMGYIERLPVQLEALANQEQVKQWLAEKGMTAYTFISKENPPFMIDVLVGTSLQFERFDQQKELKQSWGIAIPVISMDDLIGMKREASRPQDLTDIDAMLELKKL